MSADQFAVTLIYLTALNLVLVLVAAGLFWWALIPQLKARQAASLSVQNVVTQYQSGIHKRIDEVREITEAIEKRTPGLFEHEPALIFWLKSTDDFLCKLRDTALPPGRDPDQDRRRELFARMGRPASLYAAIEDRSYEALSAKARIKRGDNV